MTKCPDRVVTFGASVRGPLHSKNGQPNQDTWMVAQGQSGKLIVVCDGLGSRLHSRLGSRMACLAVRDAARYWAQAQVSSTDHLLRLVHIFWELKIAPQLPEECATTCLFALALASGRLITAALGDGLAVVRSSVGPIQVITSKRDGFSDQTMALGSVKALSAWQVLSISQFESGMSVVLTTDGISDDLLPDRLDGFVQYIVEKYSPLKPMTRWQTLCRELRDWPTPKHTDDKTIAVLCNRPLAT